MLMPEVDYGDYPQETAKYCVKKYTREIKSDNIKDEIVEAYNILEEVLMEMQNIAVDISQDTSSITRRYLEDKLRALSYRAEIYRTDIEKLKFILEKK